MNRIPPRRQPPFWMAAAVAAAAVAGFVWIRFFLYPNQLVPLTYALPLLLGLWHQYRSIHALKTLGFCGIAAAQVFLIASPDTARIPHAVSLAMMLVNILTVGVVVDRLIVYRRRLQSSNAELEQSNQSLEATNAELAAREGEIISQNEELQSQAEELERQNEELQQQSEELQQQQEELQQQSDELQHLNDEAAGRQRVLQALLEASTAGPAPGGLGEAAGRICDAALEATSHAATGAVVISRQEDGALAVLGHCGVDMPDDAFAAGAPYDDPLTATVLAERRTAAVEDLTLTPEVRPPRSKDGAPFRAALVAPILDGEQAVGAIVLYAKTTRQWTRAEFQVAEWLAAQAGLVLLSARLQQEIERRRAEAEDASQRKTRFLAAVSHDVRTPANAISLTAEVIKQAGANPAVAHEIPELAEALRSNAKLLVELVSDVLDLARFDSGKVDVDPTEFCLQDMVAREIKQYEALAATAGLSLAGSTDAGPIWLQTDRMKLARVLSNLIGNAIKFTDRGGVEVRCTQSGDGVVEIHVDDTGVGIQPTHLEHIFDEFFQIKNPERDRSKGTGLGLAICKRLVDAIGCSLTVRSRFGHGTTFTIRIPPDLVIANPQSDGAVPAPHHRRGHQPAGRLVGVRVLLVEDHEATRTAFLRLLAAEGAAVESAADGREALRMLAHQAPDVLLLDLMLPDMDGREVLRRLARRRPANLRCVLAVSGDVTAERLREVESLGADGLAPKPLEIDALVDRVRETLNLAGETPAERGQESRIVPP